MRTYAGAQRIEWAAEAGQYFAPGQNAALHGEAAERTCADGLERAGLIVQVAENPGGEGVFALTVAGWKVYREHRLVIRRLTEEQIREDEALAAEREKAATR
jgi:hypothetical protein